MHLIDCNGYTNKEYYKENSIKPIIVAKYFLLCLLNCLLIWLQLFFIQNSYHFLYALIFLSICIIYIFEENFSKQEWERNSYDKGHDSDPDYHLRTFLNISHYASSRQSLNDYVDVKNRKSRKSCEKLLMRYKT